MDQEWPGVSDEEWARLKSIPNFWREPPKRDRRSKKRGGRPRVPDRKVFNALLWAAAGGTLDRLPRRFGSRKTVERRLREWWGAKTAESLFERYIERLTPDQVLLLALWLRKRARCRPVWQDIFIVTFRVMHGDPFTRLPSCPSPPNAASPPPSSTPAS